MIKADLIFSENSQLAILTTKYGGVLFDRFPLISELPYTRCAMKSPYNHIYRAALLYDFLQQLCILNMETELPCTQISECYAC